MGAGRRGVVQTVLTLDRRGTGEEIDNIYQGVGGIEDSGVSKLVLHI